MCNSDKDADALSASYDDFEGYELRHMVVTIEGRGFHAYRQVGKRRRGRPKKSRQDPPSPRGYGGPSYGGPSYGGPSYGGGFRDRSPRPSPHPPAALLYPPHAAGLVPPAGDAADPRSPPKPQQSPPPLPPPRDRSPGIGSGGSYVTAAAIVAGKRSRGGEASGGLMPKPHSTLGPPKLSGDSCGGGGLASVVVKMDESEGAEETDEEADAGGCEEEEEEEEEEAEEEEESLPAGLLVLQDRGRLNDGGFKQQVWVDGRQRWVGGRERARMRAGARLMEMCAVFLAVRRRFSPGWQQMSLDVPAQERWYSSTGALFVGVLAPCVNTSDDRSA